MKPLMCWSDVKNSRFTCFVAGLLFLGFPLNRDQASTRLFSISGKLVDADTNTALGGVRMRLNTRAWLATADNGGFTFQEVPDGDHTIELANPFAGPADAAPFVVRVTGTSLSNLEYRVRLRGAVTGRVTDELGQPVQGATVVAVSQQFTGSGPLGVATEYSIDSARLRGIGGATTDERGEYSVADVPAGRTFHIVAYLPFRASTKALEPRRLVPRQTFYPSSESIAGSLPLRVSSLETLARVDVTMKRELGYCVKVRFARDGLSAELQYAILEDVAFQLKDRGQYVQAHEVAGTGTGFRACNVPGGAVYVVASTRFGVSPNTLPDMGMSVLPSPRTDGSDSEVEVDARSRVVVQGEIGTKADLQTSAAKIRVMTNPISRGLVTESNRFNLELIPNFAYSVAVAGLPPSLQLDDLILETSVGRRSILHSSLVVDPGVQARLSLVVGPSSGQLVVRALPQNGPTRQTWILLIPTVGDDAVLVSTVQVRLADPAGMARFLGVRSGSYAILATTDPIPGVSFDLTVQAIDFTPDTLALLVRARLLGTKVDLLPGLARQVDVRTLQLR